jgi:hypothetical protein
VRGHGALPAEVFVSVYVFVCGTNRSDAALQGNDLFLCFSNFFFGRLMLTGQTLDLEVRDRKGKRKRFLMVFSTVSTQ